jgi:hypothetical protein
MGESWSIEDVYRYPHFNHIRQFNPVYWAKSKKQLPPLIKECLINSSGLEPQRQLWVEYLVKTPLDQASERCAKTLLHIFENHFCKAGH